MSEIGDDFRWLKEHKREKRLKDKEYNTQLLTKLGVQYSSFNEGLHLIIQASNDNLVDFWPSTGKWRIRTPMLWGRGIGKLLKQLGISCSEVKL